MSVRGSKQISCAYEEENVDWRERGRGREEVSVTWKVNEREEGREGTRYRGKWRTVLYQPASSIRVRERESACKKRVLGGRRRR